jgi:hypothetical protein
MANANRPRVHITHAQLIALLMGIDHAQPVGLVTRTEPKMRKTGNEFYGRVTKITEANVFANTNYQDRINRQLAREGKEANFVAGERAVAMVRRFVNGKPTPVLDMDKKDGSHGTYFEVHFYGHLKCDTRYLLDGLTDIAKAEFQDFLQERNSSATAERQGTNEEQVVRTYSTRNIVEVRFNGTDYVVMQ